MDGSKIEWTDATFNIAWGCAKISAGCKNCYADSLSHRYGLNVWGLGAPRRTFGAKHWNEPRRWNARAEKEGRRKRVFCSSMCDVFEEHPTIDAEREKLWPLIRETPWLDWQLLTKRADRIAKCLPTDWGNGYANAWLLVSAEDQQCAEERIGYLLRVPAVVHGISYEPAIGPLDVRRWFKRGSVCDCDRGGPRGTFCAAGWIRCNAGLRRLNWLIVGGESGPGARPFEVEWARTVAQQCKAAGVPVFCKQLGAHVIDRNDSGLEGDCDPPLRPWHWPHGTECEDWTNDRSRHYQGAPVRVLLKDRKGGDPSEWPEDLRIREFPESTP